MLGDFHLPLCVTILNVPSLLTPRGQKGSPLCCVHLLLLIPELPGRGTLAALGALRPSQRPAGEAGACLSLAKSLPLKMLREYKSGQEVKSVQNGAFIYLGFSQFLVLNRLPRIKGFWVSARP